MVCKIRLKACSNTIWRKSPFRNSRGTAEAANKDHDGGGIEEGARRIEGRLKILRQSALAHDRNEDAGGGDDPLVIVSAVGKDPLDEGEERARGAPQRSAGVTILDIGGMGFHEERAAVRIDEGVTLAAIDLFTGIIAPRSARLG